MSGSRKSLQRAAQVFNPRAENSWSKDDSKFGQKMLEKMGWKKGEGIGRNGQGVKENIKIRWKLDSKGLGFSMKEDEWVAVEHDFSKLLLKLNKDSTETNTTKLSLESTSQSSRSRVHYHKFIRGKDISKYSKKDLSGILGRKEEANNEHNNNHVEEDEMNNSSAERIKYPVNFSSQLHVYDNCEEKSDTPSNDTENVETNEIPALELRDSNLPVRNKRKKRSTSKDLELKTSVESFNTDELLNDALEIDDSSKKKKVKKRKLNSSIQLPVNNYCEERWDFDLNLRSDEQNDDTEEALLSKLGDSDLLVEDEVEKRSETKNSNKTGKNKSLKVKLEVNPTTSLKGVDGDESDSNTLEIIDSILQKKVKKRKLGSSDQSSFNIGCQEKWDTSSNSKNYAENAGTDEAESRDSDLPVQDKCKKKSKTKYPNETDKEKSSDVKLNSTSVEEVNCDKIVDISSEIEDLTPKEKTKKRKIKFNLDSNGSFILERAEQNEKSVNYDQEIDNLAENKKRKKKSVVNSSSDSINIDCEVENPPLQVEQENIMGHQRKSSFKKKKRKDKLLLDETDSNMVICLDHVDGESPNLVAELEENHALEHRLSRDETDSNVVINLDDVFQDVKSNLAAELGEYCPLKDRKKRETPNFDEDKGAKIEKVSSQKKSKKKKLVTEVEPSCTDDQPSETVAKTGDASESKNEITIECKLDASKSIRKAGKVGLNSDDFTDFMLKVAEFNASTDPGEVIKKFEDNKEALLQRYRQSYLRNYLELANENDSRIYCDLNGDELDCENGMHEDDSNYARKKMKNAKPFVRTRALSKAERIVLKARLLKSIQNKSCSHSFAGSNLNHIVGYGNEIVPS